MYEIFLEHSVEKDLNRLPETAFRSVVSKIKILSDEPRPQGSRKLHGSRFHWRLRAGDYRVVYEIDDRARRVRILRVRHRKDVYR